MSDRQSVHDEAAGLARAALEVTDDWECVLDRLRGAGYPANVCVRVTQEVLSVDAHEAYRRVISSRAWSDMAEALIETQNAIFDFVDRLPDSGQG
jgi:hypothetical protein